MRLKSAGDTKNEGGREEVHPACIGRGSLCFSRRGPFRESSDRIYPRTNDCEARLWVFNLISFCAHFSTPQHNSIAPRHMSRASQQRNNKDKTTQQQYTMTPATTTTYRLQRHHREIQNTTAMSRLPFPYCLPTVSDY